MKRHRGRVLALVCLGWLTPGPCWAWGFLAHRIVVENAVRVVPQEMLAYYRRSMRRLSEASIQPDSTFRARDGKVEARRHYFDLDDLSKPPFDNLPQDENALRALFGDRRIDRAGLLPWHVVRMYERLVVAFRQGDTTKVVDLSGWLSHYVADACQPLHTTVNHDGQATGNHGVHKAFESEMIQRRDSLYRRQTRLPPSFRPERIADPRGYIFSVIIESHSHVQEILGADTRAALVAGRHEDAYSDRLEAIAGPVARRQLRRAAAAVTNLWYSAWLEAGRPSLR